MISQTNTFGRIECCCVPKIIPKPFKSFNDKSNNNDCKCIILTEDPLIESKIVIIKNFFQDDRIQPD